MAEIANIYNEAGGEPPDEPYIKKAGDTATGLIVFNGGIEVNFGSTIINGPAEFSDTVLFKPSADIIIECPITLQGPSLIIGCTDTEFTGDTVEFNNNTTTFNGPQDIIFQGNGVDIITNSSAIAIGNGGQGSLTLECGLDVGGFGSINMLNSSINMQDNSIINQFGTRTINNVLGSTDIISGSFIKYNSDLTQQTSAFTGAAALAGSYTASNITINSNGAISAISNGIIPLGVPTGSIIMYSTIVAPAGYINCDGSQYSTTGPYANLYNVIGNTFNPSAPPGFFNVPNFYFNFPIGAGFSGPALFAPGTIGGSATIDASQLPAHTHPIDFPTSVYVNNVTQIDNTSVGGTSTRGVTGQTQTFPTDTENNSTIQADFYPPYLCVNFIIKT